MCVHMRAAAAGLRQQNQALHVTVEKLLASNSELADKVNAHARQEQQPELAPAASYLESAAGDSQLCTLSSAGRGGNCGAGCWHAVTSKDGMQAGWHGALVTGGNMAGVCNLCA